MKKAIVKLFFIIFTVMIFLPANANAATMEGTWGVQWLEKGSMGNWNSGMSLMVFNSDGTGNETFSENYNGSVDLGVEHSFTWKQFDNPDGTKRVEMDFGSDGSDTMAFIISENDNMFIGDTTRYDPAGGPWFVTGVRMDPLKTYSNADYASAYYATGYEYEFSPESYNALVEIVTTDGAGNMTFYKSDFNANGTIDSSEVPWEVLYTVSADGLLTFIGDSTSGYLSGDGLLAVYPGVSSNLAVSWFNMKQGDMVYSDTSAEGTWAVSGFGDQSGGAFSSFGTLTCDATAFCSFNFKINTDGGDFFYDTGTIQLAVASDGSFGASLGLNSPAHAGAIGNGGNTIILNTSFDETDLNNRHQMIGVKCSTCSDGIHPSFAGSRWGWMDIGAEGSGSWFVGKGDITFNADGTGVETFTDNSNGSIITLSDKPFNWSVSEEADGSYFMTTYFEGETADTGQFVLSDNGEMVLGNLAQSNYGPITDWGLDMMVRLNDSVPPTNASVSGNYRGNYYSRNGTDPATGFDSGSLFFNFDGSGGVPTALNTSNFDGVVNSEDMGAGTTYSVGSSGSSSFEFSNIDGSGWVTGSGNIALLPSTNDTSEWLNLIVTKEDRAYVQSDLAGTWAIVGFDEEYDSDWDWRGYGSSYGTMTCDSGGACTLNMVENFGGGIEPWSHNATITVTSSGGLIATSLVNPGDLAPSGPFGDAGAIGDDGNVIHLNQSFDSLDPDWREVLIGVKCAACTNLAHTGKASGSLTYGGSQTGEIVVVGFTTPPTCGNFESEPAIEIELSSANGPYEIFAPDGMYYLASVIIQDPEGDGPGETDAWAVLGGCASPVPVLISEDSPLTSLDMTLTDGVAGSSPNPFYNKHYVRIESYANPNGEYWGNFNVEDQSGEALSISITGPGIPTVLNPTTGDGVWWWDNQYFGVTPPAAPATYQVVVIEASATYTYYRDIPEFRSPSEAPYNLMPSGGETVTETNPMLSWQQCCDSQWYTIIVRDDLFNEVWRTWDVVGNSINYGGAPLVDGETYTWDVTGFNNEGLAGVGSWQETFTYSQPVAPQRSDVAVDFGAQGLWGYYNDSFWSKITSSDVSHVEVGDVDGNGLEDGIYAIAGAGLWLNYDDGTWNKINSTDPEAITEGDINGNGLTDVIVDFGALGVWVYYDNSTWSKISTNNPEGMDAGYLNGIGGEDLIFDFGAAGVWAYYDDTVWTKISAGDPVSMMLSPTLNLDPQLLDEGVFDFGPGIGIWVYYDDSSWSKISSAVPEAIYTGELDGSGTQWDLVVDFGSLGIWGYYNDTSWSKISSSNPEDIAIDDINGMMPEDIVVDFGAGVGIWVFYDNNYWNKISSGDPEGLATGELDGN